MEKHLTIMRQCNDKNHKTYTIRSLEISSKELRIALKSFSFKQTTDERLQY